MRPFIKSLDERALKFVLIGWSTQTKKDNDRKTVVKSELEWYMKEDSSQHHLCLVELYVPPSGAKWNICEKLKDICAPYPKEVIKNYLFQHIRKEYYSNEFPMENDSEISTSLHALIN